MFQNLIQQPAFIAALLALAIVPSLLFVFNAKQTWKNIVAICSSVLFMFGISFGLLWFFMMHTQGMTVLDEGLVGVLAGVVAGVAMTPSILVSRRISVWLMAFEFLLGMATVIVVMVLVFAFMNPGVDVSTLIPFVGLYVQRFIDDTSIMVPVCMFALMSLISGAASVLMEDV
jgi:hypothetical protein